MMDRTRFEFASAGGTTKVLIDGGDASEAIRRPDVTAKVHYVASAAKLRGRLVAMQRAFAAKHEAIVTEGRDQGTVAFPEAAYKFFLTADEAERARRRQAELAKNGTIRDIAQTQEAIAVRDASDRNRSVGPLVPAAGAIMIDTTALSIVQVLDKMMDHIKGKR
jgi:cytidylate kinase